MRIAKENSHYPSIGKRSFRQALVHLLETEYKIIGSHKVIQMIAEDIENLAHEFFPSSSVSPGSLIWATTSTSEKKVSYRRKAEDQATRIVNLPFLTAEDIKDKIRPHSREEEIHQEIKRMVRIIKAAFEQGGLLSIAEVATIMNRGLLTVQRKIAQYQREKGDVLPFKGNILDQGSSPTHIKGSKLRRARIWNNCMLNGLDVMSRRCETENQTEFRFVHLLPNSLPNTLGILVRK